MPPEVGEQPDTESSTANISSNECGNDAADLVELKISDSKDKGRTIASTSLDDSRGYVNVEESGDIDAVTPSSEAEEDTHCEEKGDIIAPTATSAGREDDSTEETGNMNVSTEAEEEARAEERDDNNADALGSCHANQLSNVSASDDQSDGGPSMACTSLSGDEAAPNDHGSAAARSANPLRRPNWWLRAPSWNVFSPVELAFFKCHQKAMMAAAKAMRLGLDDVDVDDAGKLVFLASAFEGGKRAGDDKGLGVDDLYIDEHGMIRVDDSACARVGYSPYRYLWEEEQA